MGAFLRSIVREMLAIAMFLAAGLLLTVGMLAVR